MANPGGKRRRIHVSKNKKKSWNKYSDIKEIDDFLEEKRFEERIGGHPCNKPDEQLFFIESKATNLQPVLGSKKDQPLKCFQSLTAYSKVAIPVPENCGVIGKKQQKRISKALEKRLKNIQLSRPLQQKGKESRALREFTDLWAEDKKDEEDITKKIQPQVPCHRFQKPSLLPSVEIPHPGASYNPTYEDHQELLLEAVLVEQKKEKEERHLKRVLTDMFPTREEAPTHETWLNEMSQGLFEETGGEDLVDNEDEGLVEMGNPPVQAEDRKTKSQKRKKKMLAIEEHQRKLARVEKNRTHDVFRLRTIKAAIKQQETRSKKKRAMKDKREMERLCESHTLSRFKYTPQDLEVNLTEELPQSLRTLKVEGSILEDRYKSFQRRNIIEPRVKQRRKRKYKLKVQVKRNHRDFS